MSSARRSPHCPRFWELERISVRFSVRLASAVTAVSTLESCLSLSERRLCSARLSSERRPVTLSCIAFMLVSMMSARLPSCSPPARAMRSAPSLRASSRSLVERSASVFMAWASSARTVRESSSATPALSMLGASAVGM